MPASSIALRDVSILFPLYHGSARSLKKTVWSRASGRVGAGQTRAVVVRALQNLTLDLRSGDRLGLIGSNGAGKTTLLRVMAGIYEPVEGSVRVEGRISALLDTALGMNGELTGRENIRLRGLFEGLDRAQTRALEEDVQEFADLADFLDLPVKIYSSGMSIRLGFALATAIRPEVLLMDEWILAGDAAFLEKAKARLESMIRGADILVLSSHALSVVEEWCTRVIWLEEGRIVADGPAAEVIARYQDRFGAAEPALPEPATVA